MLETMHHLLLLQAKNLKALVATILLKVLDWLTDDYKQYQIEEANKAAEANEEFAAAKTPSPKQTKDANEKKKNSDKKGNSRRSWHCR